MTTEPNLTGDALQPVYLGPTWQKDEDGKWILPERTLGWQVVEWVNQNLQHETGDPWVYTLEQMRFMLWWYAVDANGRWLYRDGVLQRLKGWGKDPLAATMSAVEFVGPCRVDPEGEPFADPYGKLHPRGKSHPQAWVQLAAVSKDQTRNTMTLFPAYMTPHLIDEHSIDIGKEIIYAHHGAKRIEAVTSSPRAIEGGRPTFVLRNETQHWITSNEGHAMDRVIARNLAKSKGGSSRALSITNAYEPGEESVAELAREAYEKMMAGTAVNTRLLYDSVEAHPDAKLDPDILAEVIESVRGDAYWIDVPSVIDEILDVRNPPSQSRRFWFNQIVAVEDAWVSPQEWDAIAMVSPVEEGEQVTLGFDGGETDDNCALIGCRVTDGYTFNLGVWDPARFNGNMEAMREAVDAAVHQAFTKFDVVGFFCDVHPWESYIDAWAKNLGTELCAMAGPNHKIGFDMRGRKKEFTLQGAEWVHNEIELKNFRHDGDRIVREHVVNARRRPNNWGVSFGKESRESKRKVDALAALILARMARRAYLALPSQKQRRKRGRAVFA